MNYLEGLESRLFLSADPGNTLATALNIGRVSGLYSKDDSISAKDANDYYRLSVGAKGNFNVTLSGLRAAAKVDLLNSKGRLITSSIKSGRSVQKISTSLNKGTYFVRVYAGAPGATTTYTLRIQADLNWGYAIDGGSRAQVGLVWADGSTRAINPNAETWVIIHGMGSSPQSVSSISSAIKAHSKQYQVLALDWSAPAGQGLFSALGWVPSVAQYAADTLARWGIPGARIDIVGHSMGGFVAGELASDITGGVNRLIGLDPATDWPLSDVNYADNSQYSAAFIASSLSTEETALTADATFHVNLGDFNSPLTHMNLVDFFASMMKSDNTTSPDHVSALFAPERLSPSAVQPWKTDAYSGGYEGTITGRVVDGRWAPKSIVYKDATSGQQVTLNA